MNNGITSIIPLTALPPVESFMLSSMLIVVIGFVTKRALELRGGGGKGGEGSSSDVGVSELQRLTSSIQYIFADTVGGLILDKEIMRIVAIISLIGICPLANLNSRVAEMSMVIPSAYSSWISGITMGCINIIVSTIAKDVGTRHVILFMTFFIS